MQEYTDFSDIFIKSGLYTEIDDSEDSENLFNIKQSNKKIRFCKGIDQYTKKEVICKIFDPLCLQEDIEVGSEFRQDQRWYRQLMILREALLLTELHHPTIVHFEGLDLYNTKLRFNEDDDNQNQPNPVIFLEFLENKSIQTHINKQGQLNLGFKVRMIIMLGISAALNFLHKRKITHRCLNPKTIWLDNNFYPKVFDFSTSRSFRSDDNASRTVLNDNSISYKAPETTEPDFDRYNESIDVYSFGRLIYLLVTGYEPFKHPDDKSKGLGSYVLEQKIQNDSISPFLPRDMPKVFQELLNNCWKLNLNERPTAEQIYHFLFNVNSPDYFVKEMILKELLSEKDFDEIKNYIDLIEKYEKEHPLQQEAFCYKLQI